MKNHKQPPQFALYLLMRTAPSHLREEILGDLSEEFQLRTKQSPRSAKTWYWGQAIRSYPFFLANWLQRTNGQKHLGRMMILIALLGGIMCWEVYVARLHAWSITAYFLDTDFIPIPVLWRCVHISLYALGALFFIILLTITHSGRPLTPKIQPYKFVLTGVVLCIPPLFFMIGPEFFEFTLFRLGQMIAVWAIIAITICLQKRASQEPA